MKPNILLVDDDAAIRFGFSCYLSREGYVIREAASMAEGRKALPTQRFDAVILDLHLQDGYALDWISDLRENNPHLAIIVITGAGDVPLAVESMRRGADHFVCKPVGMEDLVVFLQKSLELEGLKRRESTSRRLEKSPQQCFGDGMKRALELATIAASGSSPVTILGETGTGKGVLARWIHNQSPLRSAPFVEVDCSNLRGELLASELFGHAKGAFTSAAADRQGLVELADGGTLFLDEIGEMDLDVQARLLKVVEEKQFRRLGEGKVRKSNFRLICATNRNLPEEARLGRFRNDLLFRLHVLPIAIPPLRQRPGDLPDLIRHLLQEFGSAQLELPTPVMQILSAYPWPGNIRELRNVLERALLLSRGKPLSLDHFSGIPSLGSGWELRGFQTDLSIPNMHSLRPENDDINSPTVSSILESLKKSPNGLTRSEISGIFARHRSAEEISRALRFLSEQALVSLDRTKTSGRPVERWHAKPDAK